MAFLNNYKIELLNEIGISPLWKWNNPYNEIKTDTIFISDEISQKFSPQNSLENSSINSIKNTNEISIKISNDTKIQQNNNDNNNNKNNNSVIALNIEENNCSWETLTKQIQKCNNCSLSKIRKNYVIGCGNKNADWLFIGEAPGEEEDNVGEPFVGESGKLLDNILQYLQLGRNNNIYIANTIKCRPPFNRDPTPEEIENCRHFLWQQISLIQPKIIVVLGKIAFYSLFQSQLNLSTNFKISTYRSKVLSLNYKYQQRVYKIPTFITYHPSYLLRSPSQKIETWKDLCLAKQYFEQHLQNQKNKK